MRKKSKQTNKQTSDEVRSCKPKKERNTNEQGNLLTKQAQVQKQIIMIIQIITKPTSTTNTQTHHFITTLHVLNTLQKDNTHSEYRRQKDNTRSKHKTRQNTKQLILIITLQIITITVT